MLAMRKAKRSAVASASAPSWNCVYWAKRIGSIISVECNVNGPLKQRVVLSFDDFVGASEDRRRQSEAECFWPS